MAELKGWVTVVVVVAAAAAVVVVGGGVTTLGAAGTAFMTELTGLDWLDSTVLDFGLSSFLLAAVPVTSLS